MDYRERWELKDYLISQRLERRLRLLHLGLFLLLLGFLLNFWYLQGVHGDDYHDLAENNRLRRIPVPPTRGDILDHHREVLASTRPSVNLLMRREGWFEQDLHLQLRRLSPILGIPYEEFLERLDELAGRPRFEPLLLKKDVSLEELAKIEARREQFPSVEARESARRFYPHGELLAHVLGYVGEVSMTQLESQNGEGDLRSGDIVGKSGIERAYDGQVRGFRGWRVVSVNNLGRHMGDARVQQEPRHGDQLQLTLDLDLQVTLRKALGEETGAGVFLDPKTGAVLAMLSTPSFDPNLFADGISGENWRDIAENPKRPLHDRAMAGFHPPGSTFKVVMAIAGLETGISPPGRTMFCNGSAEHYGRRRLCWKRGGHGTVDLERALAESCNVYFYQLGRELGIEEIHRYGDMLAMGRPTGIDISGEEPGILPSEAWKRRVHREPWYPGDTISVAIGQGLLAATPLQMVTGISAIATEGYLPTPHINAANARPPKQLDISRRSIRLVKRALARTVSAGTARKADLDEISVAGKTGTAQVFRHSAGIDSDLLPKAERDHAWFVGYAPADDPQIAFAVIVEHGGHGGTTAAPIVRQVLEVFFGKAEAPRDDREPPEPEQAPANGELTAQAADR